MNTLFCDIRQTAIIASDYKESAIVSACSFNRISHYKIVNGFFVELF